MDWQTREWTLSPQGRPYRVSRARLQNAPIDGIIIIIIILYRTRNVPSLVELITTGGPACDVGSRHKTRVIVMRSGCKQ